MTRRERLIKTLSELKLTAESKQYSKQWDLIMTPWMTAASLQCANTEVKASTVSAAFQADERAQQPSAQDQLLLDMGRSICSMVTELKEINQKIL